MNFAITSKLATQVPRSNILIRQRPITLLAKVHKHKHIEISIFCFKAKKTVTFNQHPKISLTFLPLLEVYFLLFFVANCMQITTLCKYILNEQNQITCCLKHVLGGKMIHTIIHFKMYCK